MKTNRTPFLLLIAVLCAASVAAQTKKPNIVILATGGTIAGAAASGTQAGYQSGAVTIDAMLAPVATFTEFPSAARMSVRSKSRSYQRVVKPFHFEA